MNKVAAACLACVLFLPVQAWAQTPVKLIAPDGTAVAVSDGGNGDVTPNTPRVVFANDPMSLTGTTITSAASTNSTSVKTAAARLMGLWLTNTTTTVYYLRLYNSSSAPTCSSATGFIVSIPIPPTPTAGQVAGLAFDFGPNGFAFTTGIGYCITAGSASTNNTSAAAGIFGFIGAK